MLLLRPFAARQLGLDLLPASICWASNRTQVSSGGARGARKTHSWAAKVPGFTPDCCAVLDKSQQALGQTMHSLHRPWQGSHWGRGGNQGTNPKGLDATGWHGGQEDTLHPSPPQPRALLPGTAPAEQAQGFVDSPQCAIKQLLR